MKKLKLDLEPPLDIKEESGSLDSVEPMIEYQKKPFDFLVNVLGFHPESIDWARNEAYENHKWDGTPNGMMRMIQAINEWKNVGCESSTGVGKTRLFAGLSLWFIGCFKPSLVITTTPKKEQLQYQIWKEIGDLYPAFRNHFPQSVLGTLSLRMVPKSDKWAIVGFGAGVKKEEIETSASRARGFHSPHMLIIFEETTGIHPSVIRAFKETSVAEHNLLAFLGNPDHQLDALHQACLKTSNLDHIRLSSYDHPNVVRKDSDFIPGATTWKALDAIADEYGEDHPRYLSKARGICPVQSKNALIRIEWISETQKIAIEDSEKYQAMRTSGPKSRGIDVANSERGDKAAVSDFEGAVCIEVRDFQCPDANELGREEAVRAREDGVDGAYIGVDNVGVGVGCLNEFHATKGFDAVTGLSGGASAVEKFGETEKYRNLRTQMWWQARRDIKSGSVLVPNDPDLVADLCTVMWGTRNGTIYVEEKDEQKKRLGRSPNKGDAFVYGNWIRQNPGCSDFIITIEPKSDSNRRAGSMSDGDRPDQKPERNDWESGDVYKSVTGRW